MRKTILFVVFVICLLLVAGCSNDNENISFSQNNQDVSNQDSNTVTVSFDTDGGTFVAPVTLQKGEKIQKPICTKEGYTFANWKIGDEVWLFEQSRVYEDVTLKADWLINQYNVKFVDYDGTVLDNQTLDYSAKISYKGKCPTEYTSNKKVYQFTRWDKEIEEVPASDVVFTAVYDFVGNICDVTYLDSKGSVLYVESLLEGSSANYSLKPNKSPEGVYIFSFRDWDKDLSNISGDITVRPIYDKASVGLTIENGVIVKYTESSSRGNVDILIPTHWNGMDVTEIGEMAFYGLKYITDIVIPEGIIKSGREAFAYSTSLKTIVFPSTIQSIGVGSFAYSSNLTTVTFGKNLEEIGGRAFQSAGSLRGVIIPKTVTHMGDNVFLNNPNCAIYLEAETIPSTWSNTWNPYEYPVYYYSENPVNDGNHWHYLENGNISFWN